VVIRTYLAFCVMLGTVACNAATPPERSDPSDEGGAGSGGRMDGSGGHKTGGSGGKTSGGSGGSVGTGGSDEPAQGGSGGKATGGTPGPGSGGTTQVDASAPPADTAAEDSAAPADGPGPSSGCTAKFCDDFEGAALGADWKTHFEATGMAAVDSTKAFSGAQSVRFTHKGAPAAMFLELRQPVLPMAGNVVYGRLMYYLTKSPTGQYSHFEIVRGTGPLPGGETAQLNTGAENGKVVINYEPGDCTKYSKVPFPEKKWTCYQFRFDGTKNDVHEWVDGMSADDVPVAPAGTCWKAPMAVDTLHIGWESYHTNTPIELWIDDVAVSDQPIPCPTGAPSKP
jgi:hypothetical protein